MTGYCWGEGEGVVPSEYRLKVILQYSQQPLGQKGDTNI